MSVVQESQTITYNRKSFTYLQSFILVLVTLVVSAVGWYFAGKYYFWSKLDLNRLNAQLTYLQQSVQKNPNDLKQRVELAYTYFLKGKNDLAIKELNQVLEKDKQNFGAYYNLGIVYSEEDRLDEALESFQKCVELSPKDFKGYLQKGIVYRKLKMFKEAQDELASANNLMPGNADIIYQVGMVAEAEGKTEDAIAIYKEALSYDPLFEDAIQALDRLQNK